MDVYIRLYVANARKHAILRVHSSSSRIPSSSVSSWFITLCTFLILFFENNTEDCFPNRRHCRRIRSVLRYRAFSVIVARAFGDYSRRRCIRSVRQKRTRHERLRNQIRVAREERRGGVRSDPPRGFRFDVLTRNVFWFLRHSDKNSPSNN